MRKPFGNDPGIFLPYWIFAVSHDPEKLDIVLYTLGKSPGGYKTKLFSLSNGKLRGFFPEAEFKMFSTAGSLTEVFQLAERLGKSRSRSKRGLSRRTRSSKNWSLKPAGRRPWAQTARNDRNLTKFRPRSSPKPENLKRYGLSSDARKGRF